MKEQGRSMASGVEGDAGEGEWLKVAKLRAMAEAQDPHVKEVDNMTLRRFLRARNQDVGKASAMLLKFVAWRREAVPGGVMPAERVRGELSDDKVRMGGLDRGGRPVVFAFPAKHFSAKRDIDEHMHLHDHFLLVRYKQNENCPLRSDHFLLVYAGFIIYLLDKICARMPRGQEKFMCIVDLKGWGYANSDVRAYIATIEIMQNYYPERLGKALMIHVPNIFMKAWKAVYPFIDTNTRAKVLASAM